MSPEDSPHQALLHFTRRRHREGDDVALLRLLNVAFDRWPASEIQVEPIEHLRWKLSSPGGAMELHRITEVDGQIASSTFCIVQEVKVRDRVVRSIQGVDSCVHPDHRGRGLAEAIRRYRLEHPDEQPCDIQFGVRSPRPALLRIGERLPAGPQPVANQLQTLSLLNPQPAPSANAQSGWSILGVDRFDERIDAFWHEAAQPFDFIVARTKDYLNWRYADPRAGRFAIRLAEQQGRIVGYAVLRISFGKGYIADLLALPGRLDVIATLLEDASTYLWDAGVSRIDCWLPSVHPYHDVLREAGFAIRKTPAELEMYSRNPEVDVSFLAGPSASLHVCAGDTDLV